MKITEHVCKRYAERVLGIPETSSGLYVKEHREEIEPTILEMFKRSTWIYSDTKNRKGTETPADYYIVGGFVFVVCQKEYIVTVYSVKLGLSAKASARVIKSLTSEIKRQYKRLDTVQQSNERQAEAIDHQLEEVNQKLARLHDRISKLDKQRYQLEKRKEGLKSKVEGIQDEIYMNVNPLIHDYRTIGGLKKQ